MGVPKPITWRPSWECMYFLKLLLANSHRIHQPVDIARITENAIHVVFINATKGPLGLGDVYIQYTFSCLCLLSI